MDIKGDQVDRSAYNEHCHPTAHPHESFYILDWARYRRRLFTPPLVRRVKRDRLTLVPMHRLLRLMEAAEHALRAEKGDVLEFGVALGGSGVLLARKARKYGCRFAGFDVFDKHPPPTSEHDDAKARNRFEEIAAGKAEGIGGDLYYGYDPAFFLNTSGTFARYGVPVNGKDVFLIKGLFEEGWPKFSSKSVAFAHIDCGWHDPVRYCLDSVAPLLTETGRIAVNAYDDFPGCRKAVDQFLADHQEFFLEVGNYGDNRILRRRR